MSVQKRYFKVTSFCSKVDNRQHSHNVCVSSERGAIMFHFQFVSVQKMITLTLFLILRHSEGGHTLKRWREQCKCKRSQLSFCILREQSHFHQAERRLLESAVSSYLLLQRYSTLSPLTSHQRTYQPVSRTKQFVPLHGNVNPNFYQSLLPGQYQIVNNLPLFLAHLWAVVCLLRCEPWQRQPCSPADSLSFILSACYRFRTRTLNPHPLSLAVNWRICFSRSSAHIHSPVDHSSSCFFSGWIILYKYT